MSNMGDLFMCGGSLSSIVATHVVKVLTFVSTLTTLLLVMVHTKW